MVYSFIVEVVMNLRRLNSIFNKIIIALVVILFITFTKEKIIDKEVNTNNSTLVQTGQSIWHILTLSMLGLMMILIGFIIMHRMNIGYL